MICADYLLQAQQYLATNQWDLSSAAAEYYTSLEEGVAAGQTGAQDDMQDIVSGESDDEAQPASSAPRGGRTLGGGSTPQAIPTTSSAAPPSSSASKKPPQKKFATLGDLGGGAHAGHGHDDDDDDEDDDEKHDLFAGGEKSALAVQNPEDLKRKIITRAKKCVDNPSVLW